MKSNQTKFKNYFFKVITSTTKTTALEAVFLVIKIISFIIF